MFDVNKFKRQVKDWIRANPNGTLNDLVDFCEEQIPPHLYTSNQWIIEQTVCWYRHILANREISRDLEPEEEESVA